MVRLWFSFTDVFNGESGIPKDLKEEAQTFFEDMNAKLEWPDLYNKSVWMFNGTSIHLANPNHWLLLRLMSGSDEELYSLIPRKVQDRHKNKTTAGLN